MFEEPELHVIRFPEDRAWREEQDRQRAEAHRRCRDRLELVLIQLGLPAADAPPWSTALVNQLFVVRQREGDGLCSCSCHPQLPGSGLHEYGSSCPCQLTAGQRRQHGDQWQARQNAYWASPEGVAERTRRQDEEDQLTAWLAAQPDVVITTYGGLTPEQWRGSVTGHSFFFRERHDEWRIELDLRPSGRFVRRWTGGDLDDEDSFEPREVDEGDVIAQGIAGMEGYGSTPVERADFIIGVIREHLGRISCPVHTSGLTDLLHRLGTRPAWCPACGTNLDADSPA